MKDIKSIPNDAPRNFGYLLAKATVYLRTGPEAYRKRDFFNMPGAQWHGDRLDTIRHGMEQICAFQGYTMETPFQGLGIRGFYDMMATLHFEVELQSAAFDEGAGTILDEMHMKHRVTGQRIILYNRVL